MPGTPEEQPVVAAADAVVGGRPLGPDRVFASYDELSDLMKEYARVHNFRLKSSQSKKQAVQSVQPV